MSKQITPYPVRLPPPLRAWLEKQAAVNYRSLNSEILARLELDQQRQQQASTRKTRRVKVQS